jgi:signal transduction histidine kinase
MASERHYLVARRLYCSLLQARASMRLAEFILSEMEAILVDWEAFAATLFPESATTTPLMLRDHAQQILEAVAKDLATPQTSMAQSEKSKGLAARLSGAETAAETHAVMRARSGMDVNELMAEYRALRASVLRLWMRAGPLDEAGLDDVIRFNEAIDQAIAESVSSFSTEVDQDRNLLLGMLGHDMRSPLSTIQATASYLAALNAGREISVAASRLIRSGASMKALLDDLVDFSRTKLGLGIDIALTSSDPATLFADELDQIQGAHPNRRLELTVSGDTSGNWDGVRLQQLLRNLVSNAIKYGEPSEPVRIALTGENEDVQIEVSNTGVTIEPAIMNQMFAPLTRGPEQETAGTDGGLGLGLYIVRQVALAHGGDVTARSNRGETVFTVRLPRQSASLS